MVWKSRRILREKNYHKELNFTWNIHSKPTSTLQNLALISLNNNYENTILEHYSILAVKDPEKCRSFPSLDTDCIRKGKNSQDGMGEVGWGMKAEGVNENWKLQDQREKTAWYLSDSSRGQNCLSVLAAKLKTQTCDLNALSLERAFNSLTPSLMERLPASFDASTNE